MRIVAGTARGHKLFSPEGMDVRPTTDKVKESLFNIIQFDVEGRRVLDLFAGTGQLGIEALSRGAAECTFIDSARDSIRLVQENLRRCGLTARVLQCDALGFLKTREKFDLIFLDPPYATDAVGDALLRIVAAKLAKPGCLVVCESGSPDLLAKVPAIADVFDVVKEARSSITYITILRYRGEEGDPE